MSKRTALIEMETFDQIKVINYWINECTPDDKEVGQLVEEVRKLIALMISKQQTIMEDAIMEQARNVDLSKMETWGR